MSDMVFAMAVPAASAFCPVDAMVDDHARMSGVDMPTMEPMEPIRLATSTICVSVEAPLLPRRTSASPNPVRLPAVSLVMLLSWPSAVAASSELRFVATSTFETVRANSSSWSVAMPSSPPMAWMESIWSALVTCVVEKSMADCLSASKSLSVPFTVLRMSRYAESTSWALCMASWPMRCTAGVTLAESAAPNVATLPMSSPKEESPSLAAPVMASRYACAFDVHSDSSPESSWKRWASPACASAWAASSAACWSSRTCCSAASTACPAARYSSLDLPAESPTLSCSALRFARSALARESCSSACSHAAFVRSTSSVTLPMPLATSSTPRALMESSSPWMRRARSAARSESCARSAIFWLAAAMLDGSSLSASSARERSPSSSFAEASMRSMASRVDSAEAVRSVGTLICAMVLVTEVTSDSRSWHFVPICSSSETCFEASSA